jgi:hypothetical protein
MSAVAEAYMRKRKPLSKEEDEKLDKAYIFYNHLYEQGDRPSFETHPDPNKDDGCIILINGKEFTMADAKLIEIPREDEGYVDKCWLCNGDPCYLEYMRVSFEEWEEDYPTDMFCNKEIRYALYRRSSELLHGRLGYGIRKPLPQCVEKFIKDKYPEEDGQYKGFQPS